MKKSLLILGALLVSAHARALPEDVSKIFSKNGRVLSNPPKSLRADSADLDSRYASGIDRVERSVGNTPEDGEEPKDNPSLNVTPEGQEAPKVVVVREGRLDRASKLSEYAFSGRRVVGVGFMGAGSYGIFGAEVDLSFGPKWSGGVGIGTGMSYSSWSLYSRYYFEQGNLSPYFQFGYAHWYLARDPARDSEMYPSYLAEQFLAESDGSFKPGTRVHMVYPAIGVLYQAPSGLAFTAQLQYLIQALSFNGALAGSFGMHFYF